MGAGRVAAAEPPIVAVATAPGTAALAVVRVSGVGAVALVGSRFSRPGLAEASGHSVHTGWITDAAGHRVDQVVCTVFRAPRSATGEDTVEVTTHGGDAAPQAVLRVLVEAGARPAGPGEFTERAFLNGKLDLAQAEAVADLIHATGTRGARAAVAQLQGRIGAAVAGVRERLIETAALVALELDFADEDVTFADRADLDRRLAEADALLTELLSTAHLGALLRDGATVVLAGRPNAGKSTLANALAGRERSIVSPTPGTTRDAVETDVEIDGLRVRLVDTAGLRETDDAVEAEGTRRARAALGTADAILYLADAARGLDAGERADLAALAAERPDLPVLAVASRADLLAGAAPHPSLADALAVSARDAADAPALLDPLRRALLAALRADAAGPEADAVAVNERHRGHLAEAQAAVGRARESLGRDADLLALDLRDALHALGLVTGAVTADDVLGAVFSRFCIGK
ncbi:MAG TPA: tRNA uridine-5-carboxymethylaminomethyl(34) synthesis GTPase MnmE [Rubricoccaceae bacterium]